MRKKLLKKTSYQRTKEEFESIKEKRRKKKEVTVSLSSVITRENKKKINNMMSILTSFIYVCVCV